MTCITVDVIRSALVYDVDSGIFTWKPRPRVGVHRPVGTVNQGRLMIRLGGRGAQRTYMAHRLAWLYCFGEWPVGQIDHIDGDPLNNRLGNLRDVSDKTNKENIKAAKRHNELGILGVRRRCNKFVAQITHNYKNRYIGIYDTAEEAHQAYLAAKRVLHASGNTL
jgi:hypothetical protein